MNAKKWWIVGSIIVASCSIGALYYVVVYIWPVPETSLARPHLLFLLFMFLSLGAGSVPVTAYFNQRFAKSGWFERDRSRLARQGVWFGLFGILLAYLQLIRALTWTIVIVLAGVFVLIEMFFITRE